MFTIRKTISLLLFMCLSFVSLGSVYNADSALFYLRQANKLKDQKRNFEADKNYQKAILFNPSDNDARLQYGAFLLDERKYFVAADQFRKVLQVNTTDQAALLKMTQASYSLRRWADVITYGNKIADKNQPRLPFMLAKAFYEEEDYGQAEGLLKKALIMDSTNIESLTLMGKVYIDLNNYNKAIFYYNKALAIDPSNANLTYEYGLLNFTSNKPKEAVKYFELAVEKGYKADLGYLENLGMAYLSFDDSKGIEILNKVLQKKPNDSQILWQIAENYYRNKKYQAASEAFFNMYQIDATNVKALYMMGVVLQKSGDKTRGISVCEEAIRLDPSLAEMKKLIFAR